MEPENFLQTTFFGAPEVFRGKQRVDGFSTNKTLALFCYLVVTRQSHTRDALAGMFWPDMPNPDAKANLRQALSNLRKLFPETFTITRQNVSFNTAIPHRVDVAEFSAAIAQSGHSSPADIERLTKAVELYRGEFLAGFYLPDADMFSEWALQMREYFAEHALQTIYTLATLHAAQNHFAQAARYFRQMLTIDPWREEIHRDLMLTLARMGQRNAAIAQYHACRDTLARELGVMPSTETRLLYERIEAGTHHTQMRLPRQPTPFIGRTAELESAAAKLTSATCRLLTIIGLGGVGKTRLAIRLAENLRQRFLDGVFFIPLAAVQTPQSLVQAIGSAVQFTFGKQGEPLAQLAGHFQQRETLLVLDNFEHLLDAVPVLEQLLQYTATLKILITSRRKLNSRWEHLFWLTGFNPDEDGDTSSELPPVVELFVQNARRIQHDFTTAPADEKTIVEIGRVLGGLPLGIELAARWVSTLTCDKILARIQHRLSFLDTDSVAGSLNAVLGYTWQEFSVAEQAQFSRLAVFGGLFTVEAAATVAELSLPALSRFVERGVLSPVVAATLETPSSKKQFTMHQLWRQFACERLAATPAEYDRAHNRHCHYFADMLADRLDGVRRRDPEALVTIGAVFNDILLAWEWLLDHGDVPEFERLTYHVAVYLTVKNRYAELRPVLEKALARLETHPEATRARIAQGYRQLGEVYFRMGELPKSMQHLRRALELLGRKIPARTMGGMLALGKEIAVQIGHRVRMPHRKCAPEESLILLEAALAYERYGQILFFENAPSPVMLFTSLSGMNLSERVGLSSVLARLYGNMILGFGLVPVHPLARFYRKNALAVAKQLQRPAALAWVLEVSSIYHCGIGAWQISAAEAQEAIAIAEALGDSRRKDESLVMLSYVAAHRGDFRRSAEIWFEIYVSARKRGDVQVQRWGLAGQAKAFVRLGRVSEAISYTRRALKLPLNVNDLGTDISCYGLLAEAYLRVGNAAEALRAAETCLSLISATSPAAFSSMGGYISTAWALSRLLAENSTAAALSESAEKAVSALQTFARVFPIGKPAAAQMSGTLTWQKGNSRKAMALWKQGIAAADALGMSFQLAAIHGEMAHHLPANLAERKEHLARVKTLCAGMHIPLP